jgi:hypothetical protein
VTQALTERSWDGVLPESAATFYITIYGPRDATLDAKASDPPTSGEPAIAGHPAAGWFRAAGPLGQTTLKIVWDAPNVVRKLGDGTWIYGLWWMKLPDHSGDVLNLRVNLPRGWSWKERVPRAASLWRAT